MLSISILHPWTRLPYTTSIGSKSGHKLPAGESLLLETAKDGFLPFFKASHQIPTCEFCTSCFRFPRLQFLGLVGDEVGSFDERWLEVVGECCGGGNRKQTQTWAKLSSLVKSQGGAAVDVGVYGKLSLIFSQLYRLRFRISEFKCNTKIKLKLNIEVLF